MADGQVSRPKRQGNYTPPHIKKIEAEIAARYGNGESARELARVYGISKTTARRIAERHGLQARNKTEAGKLLRTVEPVSESEAEDERSVARQVAEKLGYGSSAGLSYDRAFQTACARENRRRNVESRRALERRRKEFLNRIPAWANRAKIRAFYAMAKDLGLTVDHDVPLQGEHVCGLHVENNLVMVSKFKNYSKGNKFTAGPDWQIGPPKKLCS